ncbi:MAG TPA: energy transducer TonB [Acidobacteriaceae bacterium]|nr:energy transducer TonB [Acidobacteriaceae bacterium]
MTTRPPAITLACCLLALTATAQDAARTFHDAVVKHQLYLRSFSMDPHVRGHWDAATDTLVMDAPTVHSMAIFTAKSVKVKGSGVEIKGYTQIFLRDAAGHTGLSDQTDMAIQLDLRGADLNAVFPRLPGLLFYVGRDAASAAFSKHFRPVFQLKATDKCCEEPTPAQLRAEPCDCAAKDVAACLADTRKAPKGIKPPRVISQVDPKFSDKARQAKFNADIQISLDVGANGVPQNIWIIRGAGMGLDANAGEAVSQYRFAPATCGGIPVSMPIYMDVNFRIF